MSGTDPGGRSAAAIEQDVENSRARLTGTLDELRERLSPGQIFEQVVDYARGSGGQAFVNNLGSSLRDNPLPVLLIGAGIGWMMLGGGQAEPKRRYPTTESVDTDDDDDDGLGDRVRGLASGARDAAGRAGTAMGDLADDLHQGASSVSRRVRQVAGDMSSAVSDAGGQMRRGLTETANSTHEAGRAGAARAKQGLTWLTEEQPLLLGAAGLALGALLGGILPGTDAEDRLMGQTRDQALQTGREALQTAAEEVKTRVGDSAAEPLSQAVAQVGEAAGEAARNLAGQAKEAIQGQDQTER